MIIISTITFFVPKQLVSTLVLKKKRANVQLQLQPMFKARHTAAVSQREKSVSHGPAASSPRQVVPRFEVEIGGLRKGDDKNMTGTDLGLSENG